MSILFAFLVPWLTARLGDRFKPFATLIVDAGLVLVIILAAWGVLAWHDHRVLSRYVERAKYDAQVALAAKKQNDAMIAANALADYRKTAEASQLAAEQRAAADEGVIAAYEASRGTKCPVTAEDWRFITGGTK